MMKMMNLLILCVVALVAGNPDRAPQFLPELRRIAEDIHRESLHHIMKREVEDEYSIDDNTIEDSSYTVSYENISSDLPLSETEDLCLTKNAFKCLSISLMIFNLNQDQPEFCEKLQEFETCVTNVGHGCQVTSVDDKLEEIIHKINDTRNELCPCPTEGPLDEFDDEEAIRCLGGSSGVKFMVLGCRSYAHTETMKERHRVHSLNDAICLAGINLMTCLSDKASAKCGDAIANTLSKIMLSETIRQTGADNSQYCQSVEKYERKYGAFENMLFDSNI